MENKCIPVINVSYNIQNLFTFTLFCFSLRKILEVHAAVYLLLFILDMSVLFKFMKRWRTRTLRKRTSRRHYRVILLK
jgi:hypothetical protein